MNQDNNNGFELSGTLGSLNNTALDNLANQNSNETIINNVTEPSVEEVPVQEIEMLDIETSTNNNQEVEEVAINNDLEQSNNLEPIGLTQESDNTNLDMELNNAVAPSQGIDPIPTNFDIGDIGSVPPVDPTGKNEKKSKKKKIWFIILIIFFILAVGAIVFYYLRISKGTLKNAVVTKEINLEMGEELSTDINDYATFKTISSNNCILNTEKVDLTKAGSYEYSIACGTNTYKNNIIIKDSVAPVVKTKTIVKKLNENVLPEDFISSCEESSECTYAFEKPDAVTENVKQAGSYEYNVIISDSSDNKTTVPVKLIVMDTDIKVYLNCVLADQSEEGFDGAVSIINKIGISDASKYAGIYFNIKEYIATSEEVYNKVKKDYLETNILTLNSGKGTPTFDDTNLTITIEETQSGEAEFGDTYSLIKKHYETNNYKCNIVNVN